MNCRHCGRQIPDTSVFCPYCGKKLESHLRAEDTDDDELEYEEYEEPKGKRRVKALISILAAVAFVVAAFIIIMVFVKPYLGEEPWDGSKDQTVETEEETGENTGFLKNMYVSSEDGLIMRKERGQDSDAVHILNYGQEVQVQKLDEGWAYVTADGTSGWVSADYLTDDKIEVEQTESAPKSDEDKGRLVEPATRIKSGLHGVVNTEGGLNLRCGPGKDYDILLVIPDKTEVVEEGREGDWIFVKYSGEYGWINLEYVTTVQAD